MGKSKAFIDRKQAASYNLVYRNADAGQETSDRQWIESSKGVGVGRPDSEAVQQQANEKPQMPYIPRWFQDEVDDISEDRRKELIELGFPDDGYDYLKHLRVLGKGQASLEGPEGRPDFDAGPSTFVAALKTEKPEEDRKAFDARQLVLHQAAKDAVEAAQSAGGVSAFSKELNKLHKPTQADIHELEHLISQYQQIEDDEQGDLLDDFVLSATLAPPVVQSSTAAGPIEEADRASGAASDDSDDESYASSSEPLFEDISSRLGSQAGAASKLGSFASTYWRPERQDRKENLSVIDERFEAMALEYDSDDIGELDDDAEDTIQGPATVEQFDDLLTEFLEDHPTQDHNHEAGYAYDAAGGSVAGGAVDRAAVAKTLELARIAEEEEEEAARKPSTTGSRTVEEAPQQCWDCESVLSLRSNLDNHPGTISEQSNRRYRPASGKIKLAAKTGLPINSSENHRSLDFDSYSRTTSASAAQPRLKGESTDEKKQRKTAVKEAKREARCAKKELKIMFKEEAAKQHKRMAAPPSSIVPLG
ncbi:Protein ltv1 [Trebouxia sp. C0009 RCD-2024]